MERRTKGVTHNENYFRNILECDYKNSDGPILSG